MGQALYRKYRSKSLDEIVGQEHITHTLKQALQTGRISHAYLFTGPRGVGKTSIARILAHEVNGLAYDDDSAHLDIIEIDAASNRRIEEIRDLREKVYTAPTSAKYKVYIIDEVHMLTKEAFNALLKTLEEPPAHVIFILATTDAHKLPATIVSRTQRFNFKPVETAQAIAHLKHIAKAEKITVSDEALELIVAHGDGSFRDSIGLLDQAGNQGSSVDAEGVRQLLGMPPRDALVNLLSLLQNAASISDVARALSALYEQGYQAAAIAKQLSQLIREDLLQGQSLATSRALSLLAALLETPRAGDPERYLEITLLKELPSTTAETVVTPVIRPVAAAPAQPAKAAQPQPSLESMAVTPVITATPADKPAPVTKKAKPAQPPAVGDDIWPAVLNGLKQQFNTLYGVVRMCEPRFAETEDTLTLAFSFPFHQKRASETRNQHAIAEIVERVTGKSYRIECIVDKAVTSQKMPVTTVAPKKTDGLSTISNIFGGGELLES